MKKQKIELFVENLSKPLKRYSKPECFDFGYTEGIYFGKEQGAKEERERIMKMIEKWFKRETDLFSTMEFEQRWNDCKQKIQESK